MERGWLSMGKMEEIELTQGRGPTKSLQRISRQICENSKIESLEEGLEISETDLFRLSFLGKVVPKKIHMKGDKVSKYIF